MADWLLTTALAVMASPKPTAAGEMVLLALFEYCLGDVRWWDLARNVFDNLVLLILREDGAQGLFLCEGIVWP